MFTLPESPLSRQIKSRWTVLVTAGLAKNLVRSARLPKARRERVGGASNTITRTMQYRRLIIALPTERAVALGCPLQ